jgi:hypothetical protein
MIFGRIEGRTTVGGLGSGRTEGWGGPVVEDARGLDVDDLAPEGVLKPNFWTCGQGRVSNHACASESRSTRSFSEGWWFA